MNKVIITIATTLLISACSEKLPPIHKESTIVAFGDSLTFGKGATNDKSYPAQLELITGYKIINTGLNGDTANNGKERIYSVVEEYSPDVVILSLGGNDMLRRNTQSLKSDLSSIVEYLQSSKIKVILLAEPNPQITIMGLKDASVYKEIAQKYNLFLLENKFSKYLVNDTYKSDMIHLNELGYQKVAEDIADDLKKSGLFVY